jgi:hypothetical protein
MMLPRIMPHGHPGLIVSAHGELDGVDAGLDRTAHGG